MTLLPRLAPNYLPWTLSAGLLAASAWVIAGLAWTITTPGHNYAPDTAEYVDRAATNQASPSPASAKPTRSGFTRSADFYPFGNLQQDKSEAIKQAPDTRLSLGLLGVLAKGQGRGSAIISAGSSDVALYQVGDTIGNQLATLHQVHPDRIILEREGRLETLRLPRGEDLRDGNRRTDPLPQSSQPAGSTAPVTASVSRSRWLKDPEQAMNSMRVQPVIRDGTLTGIRVTPTRNQREFERAGLMEGDIITSIQGQQIGDIDDPDQILAGLDGIDRVNITIERDGQTLPLAIELTE
ncbi:MULTISPECIES: type II secretion system protein GspC [unclassified Thioalkalivibrio]|uniref:type II secretion system protein GspC n=1 Tax=unclassified Thioalkalivibrio TaxID=2621013 RepID=UPI00036472E6|nr:MULTISPECIES: type II secretion system protein GspC [unclassified Thioalkalivibrio]